MFAVERYLLEARTLRRLSTSLILSSVKVGDDHRLGHFVHLFEGKYRRVGLLFVLAGTDPPGLLSLDDLRNAVESSNLDVVYGTVLEQVRRQ